MRVPPKVGRRLFRLLLVLSLGVRFAHAQSSTDTDFLMTLGELREASYADKESIVERLTSTGHPSVRAILNAFIEDRLYYKNGDQSVVVIKPVDESAGEVHEYQLIDPVSLKPAGSISVDDV
ncbi:MAG TPA: hypothetical protein VFY29_11170, partial [Terriglobia bacterium]|nr:hypothetical protein [Terriglobia bacterium]